MEAEIEEVGKRKSEPENIPYSILAILLGLKYRFP